MSRPVSEADIEQAEEEYRSLEETYRQLGSRFAQTVREGRSLEEFQSLRQDISYLLRKADLRRTELRHEYLTQRLKGLENEYRQALRTAERAAEALKKARRANTEAQSTERRLDREVRHLRELHKREEEWLERLTKESDERDEAAGS